MLEAKNISVHFETQEILQDVSISLNYGDRAALLGPSGAGKSTLLRILSGIQKPSSGKVIFDGIEPKHDNESTFYSRKWVWPKVTLVFQDLQLFPSLSGFENCSISLQKDPSIVSEELMKLAVILDIAHCMDKIPSKMSQGEQQRVSILRALVKHPQFLLMDEPTSAIDPIMMNRLANLLIDQSKNNEMGLLVATHDWDFANKFANKFIVVRNCKLRSFDTIEDTINEMSGMTKK